MLLILGGTRRACHVVLPSKSRAQAALRPRQRLQGLLASTAGTSFVNMGACQVGRSVRGQSQRTSRTSPSTVMRTLSRTEARKGVLSVPCCRTMRWK